MYLKVDVMIFSKNESIFDFSRLWTTIYNWKYERSFNSQKTYLSFKNGLFSQAHSTHNPLKGLSDEVPYLLIDKCYCRKLIFMKFVFFKFVCLRKFKFITFDNNFFKKVSKRPEIADNFWVSHFLGKFYLNLLPLQFCSHVWEYIFILSDTPFIVIP